MTQAWETAGWAISAFSSSTEEIHSPALYEVFAAVGDLDKPKRFYGDDVPRLEPTVVVNLSSPSGAS